MGRSRTTALIVAAFVAAVAGPSPTSGQCRLCKTPVMTRDVATTRDDVAIEVETSLNFDRLVLAGSGDGAAVIRPDGSRGAEGAIATVGARAVVGSVRVHGEPGRIVRVELPSRIQLYSLSGGQILVDEVASDLPSLPRLDSAGNLSFRFGGRVRITGDSAGDYRGDLPITVEYQ
jgi:hypothetical protein